MSSVTWPAPLWVACNDSSDGSLLPDGCDGDPSRICWLLLTCTEGEIPLLHRGDALYVKAGEAILLALDEPALSLRPATRPWRTLAFAFVGFNDLVTQLRDVGPRLRLPLNGWAMRHLHALAEQEAPSYDLNAGMRLVFGVLANLVEHNVAPRREDPVPQLIRRAMRLLDELIEEPISMGEVAERLGISASHLSRAFKAQLGSSPSKYLQQRRMRRACELLRAGEDDVAAIATRLCYESRSAFTNVFRQMIGMSPSEYRNSNSVPLWEHSR